jgi:hypothetical protein
MRPATGLRRDGLRAIGSDMLAVTGRRAAPQIVMAERHG